MLTTEGAGIPALIEALQNDRYADVRMEAAAALGKMGPDADVAIPALKLGIGAAQL
jgi:HEAT repeat protein